MPNDRNEVSYYPEIQRYIEEQLKSNFRLTRQRDLFVYWGIGELKTNLQRIISEHPAECECARPFANRVPPLNLDIFALITDGEHFELLILEVKLLRGAGLKEWSQLVGYCLNSTALARLVNYGKQAVKGVAGEWHSAQLVCNIPVNVFLVNAQPVVFRPAFKAFVVGAESKFIYKLTPMPPTLKGCNRSG